MDDFNPHSREGRDDQYLYWSLGVWDFNPHSREGSDAVLPAIPADADYFNPHSREGSDLMPTGLLYMGVISIHTPAKGVTMSQWKWNDVELISIHTPAKGVTSKCI